MTIHEINSAIAELSQSSFELENEYIANGGECTDLTEAMEARIEAVKALINTEGVDSLGRWLKSKEDEISALKAEKDYITRKMTAADNTISYIKGLIWEAMNATETNIIKGANGYSFTTTTAIKTTVDKQSLNNCYLDAVQRKLEGVLPQDVTVTLNASVKLVENPDYLPCYYERIETPTVTFRKPKVSKEA